jgi:molybdopterin molybdotransferase
MTTVCDLNASALLPLTAAQEQLRSRITALTDTEHLPLSAALGRVLARPQFTPIDLPPQRNAAMDGYAFAAADCPVNQPTRLAIAGTSWAGNPFIDALPPQHCVRIFTGAVVPEGADSVIPQELVQASTTAIQLAANPPLRKHIRAAGSDLPQNSSLIANAKRLTAIDIGLLASAGIASVPVVRKVKIGLLSTGDELAPPSQPLASGQIYDSNRSLLQALLHDSGFDVTDYGIIPDQAEALKQAFGQAAAEQDLLISSGGASVGDADYVQQTLQLQGEVHFWQLAIKPGKPFTFGRLANCWVMGLPGNPVAVWVTFLRLVDTALRQLQGLPAQQPLQLLAQCVEDLRKSPGRQDFQRGIFWQASPGQFQVKAVGAQESHQLGAASLANCFMVLPAASGDIAAGETVIIEPFSVYL